MDKTDDSAPRRLKISGIRSVIILSFTVVAVLAMLIVSAVLYTSFSASAERNAAASSQQILQQVVLNLENYMNGMADISDLIRSNLAGDIGQDQASLADLLRTTSSIRKDIKTIAVYKSTGELVASYPSGGYDKTYSVLDQDWFKSAAERPIGYIFKPPHVQRMFTGTRPWVVTLCRSVSMRGRDGPETGVIVVDMNFSAIEQLCSKVSLGKRGYLYIMDRSGNIIYHPQQQLIYVGLKQEDIDKALNSQPGSYSGVFQGEQRITTVTDMGYTGWRIIGIIYVDELVENKSYFMNNILVIVLFGIVFEVVASLFVSAKITQPIIHLESQMKKVESGNFDISVDVTGEDEVKRLSRTFNVMIARIRALMEQSIREQEEIRKSELKALQAQINPHFLYNTLDSIVWMNENHNFEGVTVMVNALAKFFRISISRGNEIISVGDEIEHARSYLIIQQIRYKNQFSFTIEAEPDVCEYKTLKLILQPIVENAIYHGVANLQEKGLIAITAALAGDAIVFRVLDNGYGIKPEILKGILQREASGEHGSGVGLKNVNERVRLYYGAQYGVGIMSKLEEGTAVEIRIPVTKEGETDANA